MSEWTKEKHRAAREMLSAVRGHVQWPGNAWEGTFPGELEGALVEIERLSGELDKSRASERAALQERERLANLLVTSAASGVPRAVPRLQRAYTGIGAALRTGSFVATKMARDEVLQALHDLGAAPSEAADVAAEPTGDQREALARELYDRIATRTMMAVIATWHGLTEDTRRWWRTLVDVIGEIERERQSLHVLALSPDGTQTARVVPEGWQPLTEAEARVTGEADTPYGRLPILDLGGGDGPPCPWCGSEQHDGPTHMCTGEHAPKASGVSVTELARDHVEGGTDNPNDGDCSARGLTLPAHEADCPKMRPLWTPKPGDRVRTAEKLKDRPACARPCGQEVRRVNVAGVVDFEINPEDGGGWQVTHDDGTEAPYDADELRPEGDPK